MSKKDKTNKKQDQNKISASAQNKEASLKNSEKYRSLFENAPNGISLLNAKGSIIDCNPKECELLGYKREEIIGKHITCFFKDEFKPLFKEKFPRLQKEGKVEIEFVLKRKDNSEIPVQRSATALYDDQGNFSGVIVHTRDITERKQAELALQENRRRYNLAAKAGQSGIWDLDLETNEIYVDPVLKKILGYEDHEIKNHLDEWGKLVHPDDRDKVGAAAQAHFEGKAGQFVVEHRMLHKDGSIRWFFARGVAERKEDNTPYRVLGTDTDITERKNMEEALRKSEEKYRLIGDNTSDLISIISFSLNPKHKYVSPSHKKILGYEQQDLLGKHGFDFVHPKDRLKLLPLLKKYIALKAKKFLKKDIREFSENLEFRFKNKSGEWRDIESRANILDENNLLFVSRDVTARKKAEQTLQNSENNLRALFNAMTDVVLELDYNGTYINIAPTSPNLLFKPAAEVLGKTLHEVFPKSEADKFLEVVRKCLDEKKLVKIEYPLQINGKLYWFEGRATPKDKNTILYIAHDITERKEAEKALRESEKNYQEIFNAAHDMIVVHDIKTGAILDVNKTSSDLSGYTLKEIKEMGVVGYSPKEKAYSEEKIKEYMAKAAAGQPQVFEWAYIRKNGEKHPTEVSLKKATIKGEERLLAIIRDITQRKKAEQELRTSEANLERVQQIAHLGSWEWELETDTDYWSEETYKIFGIHDGKTKLTYSGFLNSIHPEDREFVKKSVETALSEHKPYSIDHRIIRQDGEVRFVHELGEVILDENGEPVKMIGTTQDITERKKAENIRTVLYHISNAVNTTENIDKLYQIIHQELGQIIDASNFYIANYNEETGEIVSPYFFDEKFEVKTPHLLRKKGVTNYIIRNGKPLFLTEELRKKLIEKGEIADYKWKSKILLGTPLKIENKVVGCIVVRTYKDEPVFSENDLSLLEYVSDQVAVAIARKRATEKEEHLNAILRAIRNVNQLIVQEKDPHLLIQKACQDFIETRGFHSAWIVLFDDREKIIDFVEQGLELDLPNLDNKLIKDFFPPCFTRSLKSGEVVLIRDIESECKNCPRFADYKTKNCSVMSRSLNYEGKNYGVINVSLETRFIDDKAEHSLFEEVAGDLAYALYNIELEEQRKHAEERAEHLNAVLLAIRNVNQLIVQERDRHQLIREACRNFIETRGFRNAWIALFDDQGKCIDFIEDGSKADLPVLDAKFLKTYIPPCVVKSLNTDDVILIRDGESECQDCPRYKKLKPKGWSALSRSLKYEDKIYGVINVSLETRFIDDEEEHSLFDEVAGDIAYALYNIETEEQRKQAESSLRESEQRFKEVAENALEWIWEVDENGLYTYASPIIETTLGYKPEEIVGKKHFYDLFHPEDREALKKAALAAFAERQPFKKFPNRNVHKNGNIVWLLTSGVPTYDEKGRFTGYRGADSDITESKKAEEILRANEQLTRTVIENSPIGISIRDMHGTLILSNEAWQKIWGLTKTEIVAYSKTREKLVFDDKDKYLSAHFEEIRRVYEKGGEYYIPELKLSIPKKDKANWISQLFYAITDDEGKVQRVVILTEDISERKKASEQIKNDLHEKEILLNEIHHRVKNNLQVISSLLKLQEYYMKDKKVLEIFRKSENRIRSMALIHQKLYETRDFVHIDVESYIKGLSKMLFGSYEISPAKIKLELEIQNIALDISRAIPIALILNELISNSLKYAFPEDKRGEIKIVLKEIKKNNCSLIYKDNGIGLPDNIDHKTTNTLGIQLINMLTQQISGEISLLKEEGALYNITFKTKSST